MIEQPLVSIAIPAFNPEFFSRALLSAIFQRYANLEVIVCDDSQGGEIKAIVDEWAGQAKCELRYVHNPVTLVSLVICCSALSIPEEPSSSSSVMTTG